MKLIRTLVVAVVVGVGFAACGGGGSDNNAFCEDMRSAQNTLQNFNPFDEQQLNALLTLGAELLQSAPGDVKGDVQKLVDAAGGIQQGQVPNAGDLIQSVNNIADAAQDKCNIDLTGPLASLSSASSSLSEGGATDGASAEFCTKIAALVSGTFGTDEEALQAFDEVKDVTPPSQIAAEWSALVDAVEKVRDANPSNADYAQLQAEWGQKAIPIAAYYGTNCLAAN